MARNGSRRLVRSGLFTRMHTTLARMHTTLARITQISDEYLATLRVTSKVFASHFGHLSIVSTWFSAIFFGGSRFSNYDSWLLDPSSIRPSAQIVYSGSSLLSDPFNGPTTDYKGISISSGVYSAWFSAGLITTSQLLSLSLG